jgi:hypothetical protein
MKQGDLVLITEPHWAAGLTGLFVDSRMDYCVVSIEWEGSMKDIEVPYDQLTQTKKKDNL